jgi:hypothetical protein
MKKGDASGQAYHFMGEKAQGMAKKLAQLRRENAQRVRCPICRNLVRPELMPTHREAFHS